MQMSFHYLPPVKSTWIKAFSLNIRLARTPQFKEICLVLFSVHMRASGQSFPWGSVLTMASIGHEYGSPTVLWLHPQS